MAHHGRQDEIRTFPACGIGPVAEGAGLDEDLLALLGCICRTGSLGVPAGNETEDNRKPTETKKYFLLGQMNRLSKGNAESLELLQIVFGTGRIGGSQWLFCFMMLRVIFFHRNIAVAAVTTTMAAFADMVGASVLGAVHADVARDVAADGAGKL